VEWACCGLWRSQLSSSRACRYFQPGAVLIGAAPLFKGGAIALVLWGLLIAYQMATRSRANGLGVDWRHIWQLIACDLHSLAALGSPSGGSSETTDHLSTARCVLAHEYATLPAARNPWTDFRCPWLDEGFACWFSEQAIGLSWLTSEGMQWMDEPESHLGTVVSCRC